MYDHISISIELESQGIKTYDVEISADILNEGILFLEYAKFLEFLKENNINSVFLYEKLVNPEDYVISKKTFRNVELHEYQTEAITPLVEEYNDLLWEYEFDTPEFIFVIAIWNGQKFYYIFQNEVMLSDEVLLAPEDKLIEIIDSNIDTIKDFNKEKEKRFEKQKSQIKKHILKDAEFKKCTNQQRRYEYLQKLITTDDTYSLLAECWVFNYRLAMEARYFIDDIWQEVKGK